MVKFSQRGAVVALVGAFVAFPAAHLSARADSTIATESVPVPGAPIEYKCIVGFQDSAISRFYLGVDFAFRILGSQAATAVKFDVDLYDAFGTKIGQTSAQKTGFFSPGVTIMPDVGKVDFFGGQGLTGPWEYKTINGWPNLDSAKCYISAIRWQNDTVWRRNVDAVETPSPDTVPVPDSSNQIAQTDNTQCSEKWLRRVAFSARQWRATGDTCAAAAQNDDAKGWGVAAARDHARAYVAYTHAGDSARASAERALVQDKIYFVPMGSTLYALLRSPLLAVDGATKDSALDGPLVFTSVPSPPPVLSPP